MSLLHGNNAIIGLPQWLNGKNKKICLQCRRHKRIQVWSLGWEDPLEEGVETHSSILTWRTPMDREAWQAAVHMVAESDTTEVTEHN